tara:strand:- start:406 stop:1878 length:1473 start_codon:yes stop_codon:yes gene_type:complete
MRTKKNNKNRLSGGSYSDKSRVTRSCSKYSSRPLRGNISKCRCETTGDEFSYDNRFFECTETGFSLIDSSQVNQRFVKLINKITEFDDTYGQYESRDQYSKEVKNFINKEYSALGIDVETKKFLIDYILDDFKYQRRFKGEVGTRNTEILIRNLDKIKRKILKRKESKASFTLVNLKEELKEIIRTLENHVSQVNRLLKDDELNRQIKGDPFSYTATKTDLAEVFSKIKSGELTLSKQDLNEKINDAFKIVIKDIINILEKYTDSNQLKTAVKIKLDRDFGDNSESKKRFYFKYNSSSDSLKRFSIKFIKTVIDSEGVDSLKKFVNKSKLIEFIKLLVKYDSNFKDGAEKGVEKYFEGYSLTSIVEKIQQYTTVENFLTREKSAIQSSAGLQFSDEGFNSSKSSEGTSNADADRIVSKLVNILKNISRDDASKLSNLVKKQGGNKRFVQNNRLTRDNTSLRKYLKNFLSSIHNDRDRLNRRLSSLGKMNL